MSDFFVSHKGAKSQKCNEPVYVGFLIRYLKYNLLLNQKKKKTLNFLEFLKNLSMIFQP